MNKIFRIIWNYAEQNWIVASELASRQGKSSTFVDFSLQPLRTVKNFFFNLISLSVLTSFPLIANAYVAISNTSNGSVSISNSAASDQVGDTALDYKNPGNLSYLDPTRANDNGLYSGLLPAAHGIAIGTGANAMATAQSNYVPGESSGVAIGDYSKASGALSFALGPYAIGSHTGATAIGTASRASGFNSLAMMRQSSATNDYAMAIGNVSWASGKGSLAIGQSSQAAGHRAIAIGSADVVGGVDEGGARITNYDASTNTQALGERSIAFGASARTTKSAENSIAIGSEALVTATNATAVGINAQAMANNAISIGNSNVVGGSNSGAIGISTTITGSGTHSMGNENGTISVDNSGVFGNNNTLTAQATASRVVGNHNYVNGQESFVLGNDVKVQKDKAGTSARVIGIGSNVTVNDNDSIAIGTGTYTEGNFVTAMGNKANASGDQALAIGSNTVARESSTALGQQAQATGNTTLAVGAVAKAEGNNSMAVGQYSQAVGASSTAVGPGAIASENNAVALGYSATAAKSGALALGYAANASLAGSVALGENSVTGRAVKTASATVNGITYSGFAGSNIGTSRVVSVGIADTAATDTTLAIKNQQRQIQNVAAGRINPASTDAINGSQLYMVANTLGNVANTTTNILGGNATLDPNTGNITMTDIGGTGQNTINDAIKVAKTRYYSVNDGGKQSANYNNDGAKSEGALAAGVRANAIGADDVAIGSNALADSSNVDEPAAVAVGHNAKATAAGAVAVGDSAEALSTNVVSMGYSAGLGSNAENSIWIGTNSGNSATGYSNIGIGDGAGIGIGETNPDSNHNVAMGIYAGGGLNGSNNLSLGISAGNALNGNDNVTLGNAAGANLNGNNNIAIGRQAGTAVVVNSDPNNPIFESGDSDTREVNDSISLGNNAQALKDNAIAVGLNAQAKNENDVALGAGAITETAVPTTQATVNKITYNGFVGTSPIATLSVGSAGKERTITNVAAGRINKDSTDAINGSQLYVVADKLSNAVNNITNATNGGFILTDDSKTEVKQDLGKSIQLKGEKGITVTTNAADKQLKIALGNEITVGNPEDPSNPAAQKEAGTINVVGKDGKNGVSIKGNTGNDGKPGISIAGKDGADGVTLTTKTDGKPGVDGKDGPTKPRLEVNNEQVATLNDGVKYAGDIGNAAIKLNQTATIVGGVKDKSNLTDNNIGIVAEQDGDNAKLTVKLAKNLNLGPDGSVTMGDTKISNADGITISNSNGGSPVKLNKDGLDNGGNKITNLADGDINPNSKDAVNGGQLYTVQQAAKAAKTEVKEGDNIVVTSDVGSDGQTIYTVSTAKDVKFDNAKIGDNVSINNDGINAGNTKVTGVNAGDVNKDSSDAVNGSQLYNTAESVANALGGNSTVNPDGTVSKPTYKVTDLTDGTGNTKEVHSVGDAIEALDKAVTTPLTFSGDNTSKDFKRKLGSKVNVRGGADESKLTEKNIGVVSDGSDTLTVKLSKDIDLGSDGSVTMGDTKINNADGITISNSNGDSPVKLSKDGLDNGGNKITNVADGNISPNSKDAVNGSQLYTVQQAAKAAKTEVKAGENITVTPEVGSNDQTIYTVSTAKDVKFDSAKIGNNVSINNDGINAGNTKVTGVKAGDVNADSTDAVNGSQLHETNQNVAKNAANIANNTAAINKGLNFTADDSKTLNRQLGDTVAVNGDENITTSVTSSGVKVALNKNLKVDSVATGNTVVNNDGVTIGTGDKAVSLTQNGLNNGGNRITNVAPGKDPTDAVNVAQLSNVANHLDNKVNKVAGDMKRMDKKLRAGIAGAAALGMLAQPTRPGKSMVSVGGTTYRNESAVALGVSRVSDNEKWVIKVGASANTRNNYIVGGSVGYQW
ncbi:YadA-like family protein [Avibacterium endocarditidis]|uniref:YadA-like family protein n=2 Tax=Avibacterium endocarditidis TaxID=380674 RepID=UPI003BF872A4